MALTPVDQFFSGIEPYEAAYRDPTFAYLAVKSGEGFSLLKCALFFHTAPPSTPLTHFRSENVRAGQYLSSDLGLTPRALVDQVLSGEIKTPDGDLAFPTDGSVGNCTMFNPLWLERQQRTSILSIAAGRIGQYLEQPAHDWEVKASATPYDGLYELLMEYDLGGLAGPGDPVRFEAIAFTTAFIAAGSRVEGKKAIVNVRAAEGLNTDKVSLGYRVISKRRCVKRGLIQGGELEWAADAPARVATAEFEVPLTAVVHCIASYDGVAQHHFYIHDPSNTENHRRAAYEVFDPNLETLQDNLAKIGTGKGQAQRNFESGVACLLWMLGFNPVHIGGDGRLESPDLVVATPIGNLAVVECTTGVLKAESKMTLLIDRTERIRKRVAEAAVRVLPVMVTSKTRDEVRGDIEAAEKLGVVGVSAEGIKEALDLRTLLLPDPEGLYAQAEEAIRSAQAKHEAEQPPLPGM